MKPAILKFAAVLVIGVLLAGLSTITLARDTRLNQPGVAGHQGVHGDRAVNQPGVRNNRRGTGP